MSTVGGRTYPNPVDCSGRLAILSLSSTAKKRHSRNTTPAILPVQHNSIHAVPGARWSRPQLQQHSRVEKVIPPRYTGYLIHFTSPPVAQARRGAAIRGVRSGERGSKRSGKRSGDTRCEERREGRREESRDHTSTLYVCKSCSLEYRGTRNNK
ncbi:hypothetical protein CgunFtcFv8_003894 [Champsocephalus gunnari]|uniref:Uncharacterized protein n=1 Tax=Champsocephalus gunnari TaxID=52237 RepID=A0AAN8HXN8_CHAGU|nr:hypothetical protein CgunFtcFv8_003894 [Champsocephalus gunnari]